MGRVVMQTDRARATKVAIDGHTSGRCGVRRGGVNVVNMATLAAMGGAGEIDETPRLPDAVLAVALAAAASLDLRYNLDNSTHYGSDFATGVVVAVATLGLAWRRRWPFATLCVVAAAIAGPELFGTLTFTLWGHFVPLLVASYTAARWCDCRLAVIGAAVVGVAIAVVLLRVPATGSAGNIAFAVVPAAALMITGRVLRRRHAQARELSERARRLETEHEAEVAVALTAERGRIARELHDVVAHCVSVMVVQAGVSEALLDRSPERAREPLQAVQETGREAIAELTRMLGLLRDGSAASPHRLAPQPGVAQLPELVERLTASGLCVQVASVGDVRPLPPGVDLTVFRIAQEALTNTLKHAGPGAEAHVELRYLPGSFEIEVTDDGLVGPAASGSGHGLIGMAERASVFGGAIEAGVRPEGGFRVLVALPMEYR
jgi:signal transduction histidine kinase